VTVASGLASGVTDLSAICGWVRVIKSR
jgi:hypothetical protein